MDIQDGNLKTTYVRESLPLSYSYSTSHNK